MQGEITTPVTIDPPLDTKDIQPTLQTTTPTDENFADDEGVDKKSRDKERKHKHKHKHGEDGTHKHRRRKSNTDKTTATGDSNYTTNEKKHNHHDPAHNPDRNDSDHHQHEHHDHEHEHEPDTKHNIPEDGLNKSSNQITLTPTSDTLNEVQVEIDEKQDQTTPVGG
jgi:hypothetical protein